jgi:hypothetical protein
MPKVVDGNTLDAVIAEGEYEATGAKLQGDAWREAPMQNAQT